LKDVENVDSQKLEALRRIDRSTYDAVIWLRNNKHLFSGTVYEPIVTQVFNIFFCILLQRTINVLFQG